MQLVVFSDCVVRAGAVGGLRILLHFAMYGELLATRGLKRGEEDGGGGAAG